MATIYSESDCDPSVIKALKVAVVGFGSQGHAHALNLRDSGVDVRVGLYPGSPSWAKAESQGLTVVSTEEAARWADVLMLNVPDVPMAGIYRDSIAPHLRAGQALLFSHGFNVHYGLIQPPPEVDVALVAPKGQGHGVRRLFLEGKGMPALMAVAQDASGRAKQIALSYAWAIGCARALVLESSFRDETEADLFAEQAVLCGGLKELVKAGWETLVEAGYSPEAAFFECLHELKLIVDLMAEDGVAGMLEKISDTAEWGAYVGGPAVVTEDSRRGMRELLSRIQDGSFAQQWVEENEAGQPRLKEHRAAEREHPLQKLGDDLRARMNR